LDVGAVLTEKPGRGEPTVSSTLRGRFDVVGDVGITGDTEVGFTSGGPALRALRLASRVPLRDRTAVQLVYIYQAAGPYVFENQSVEARLSRSIPLVNWRGGHSRLARLCERSAIHNATGLDFRRGLCLLLRSSPRQVPGGLMRQISALMLLGAALGIMAPLGAAGRVEPVQAQNQAPPPEGFRIIGNIYWVGGEYGSYLITTPQGHILHDTGTNEMHDVIVSNVKKLGFDVKDIKVIISSHAHFDHVQGHAAMKRLTGAQ